MSWIRVGRASGCRVWGSRLKVTGIRISVFFHGFRAVTPGYGVQGLYLLGNLDHEPSSPGEYTEA